MGELIAKDRQGHWMLKGVPWELLQEGQPLLKAYEDTGYSPENVEHIRYVLEDAVKELEKCQGQTKITEEIWHYLRM